MAFNLPEGEAEEDKSKLIELIQICEVAITPAEITDVRRIGSDTAQKPRPLRMTINADVAEDKKKRLFKNLAKLRDFQKTENGGIDPDKPIVIGHDMSQEQRAEKKKLLQDAYKQTQELGPNAEFAYRVRGPPWAMFVTKINKNNMRPARAPLAVQQLVAAI